MASRPVVAHVTASTTPAGRGQSVFGIVSVTGFMNAAHIWAGRPPPVTFFIDSQGKVVASFGGQLDARTLEHYLALMKT